LSFLFTAKRKQSDLKQYRKALKRTGNKSPPPEPAAMTDAESAVYLLLSESPGFKGIANSDDESDVIVGQDISGK